MPDRPAVPAPGADLAYGSRAPTLLDLIARDPATCKASMEPNPWVVWWSMGVIGCHNMVVRGGWCSTSESRRGR